jgi:hypothetical protein
LARTAQQQPQTEVPDPVTPSLAHQLITLAVVVAAVLLVKSTVLAELAAVAQAVVLEQAAQLAER